MWHVCLNWNCFIPGFLFITVVLMKLTYLAGAKFWIISWKVTNPRANMVKTTPTYLNSFIQKKFEDLKTKNTWFPSVCLFVVEIRSHCRNLIVHLQIHEFRENNDFTSIHLLRKVLRIYRLNFTTLLSKTYIMKNNS